MNQFDHRKLAENRELERILKELQTDFSEDRLNEFTNALILRGLSGGELLVPMLVREDVQTPGDVQAPEETEDAARCQVAYQSLTGDGEDEWIPAFTSEEEADRLRADLAGEDAWRITLDDTFRSDNAKDVERLQVLLYNHDVDAVIAGEDVIRTLAAYGYFQDITGVLAEDTAKAAASEGRLFRTAGYLDTEEISMEDHETGRGEILPYGLRLAGSSRWKSLTGDTAPDYLAAVMCESEHMKEVSALVSLLA